MFFTVVSLTPVFPTRYIISKPHPAKLPSTLDANTKQQHQPPVYGSESNMESRNSPDQFFEGGAENKQENFTADKGSQTDVAERTETLKKDQLPASVLEWRKRVKAREVNMGTGLFVDINNMLDEERAQKRAAARAQPKARAYIHSSDIWMVNIETEPPNLDGLALDQQACVSRDVANEIACGKWLAIAKPSLGKAQEEIETRQMLGMLKDNQQGFDKELSFPLSAQTVHVFVVQMPVLWRDESLGD